MAIENNDVNRSLGRTYVYRSADHSLIVWCLGAFVAYVISLSITNNQAGAGMAMLSFQGIIIIELLPFSLILGLIYVYLRVLKTIHRSVKKDSVFVPGRYFPMMGASIGFGAQFLLLFMIFSGAYDFFNFINSVSAFFAGGLISLGFRDSCKAKQDNHGRATMVRDFEEGQEKKVNRNFTITWSLIFGFVELVVLAIMGRILGSIDHWYFWLGSWSAVALFVALASFYLWTICAKRFPHQKERNVRRILKVIIFSLGINLMYLSILFSLALSTLG